MEKDDCGERTTLETFLSQVDRRLEQLQVVIHEIHKRVNESFPDREAYSTKEAAELLDRKPFTVREWCRLGRVNAFKIESGRGQDDEWRISHEEIIRIRNEGLMQRT